MLVEGSPVVLWFFEGPLDGVEIGWGAATIPPEEYRIALKPSTFGTGTGNGDSSVPAIKYPAIKYITYFRQPCMGLFGIVYVYHPIRNRINTVEALDAAMKKTKRQELNLIGLAGLLGLGLEDHERHFDLNALTTD